MATGNEASAQEAESDYRPFWLRPGLLLTLASAFTVLASMSAVTASPASLPAFAPFLIVAILIYWSAVYALVRSMRLAALAAGAVFLAFLWAFGILALARIALTPAVIAVVLAVNIVGATAIAQQLYGFLTDTCRGMVPVSAAHKAVRQWARPALAGLFAALAGVVALTSFAQESLVVVMAAGWAAVVAMAPLVIAIVPALASLTRFDEIFVVRVNRVRETRENWLAPLVGFVVLRWALAILGITVVLSTIVFFDGGRVAANPSAVLLLWAQAGPALGAALVVGGLLSALGVGDLRAFFSCAVPAFLMSTLAAWASLHLGLAGPAPLAGLLVLGAGVGTGIGCVFAAGIAVYQRFGDDVATAFARALNDCGLVVLSVGAAGLAAAALFGGRYTLAWPAALTIAAELVGILVLMPVLATVLDDVLPRRRSVEELYGAG